MQPAMTDVPTVDTARFVAVVGTVMDFVTLLGAVDAGTITALELIGTTRQQGCKRHTHINTLEIGLVNPL